MHIYFMKVPYICTCTGRRSKQENRGEQKEPTLEDCCKHNIDQDAASGHKWKGTCTCYSLVWSC